MRTRFNRRARRPLPPWRRHLRKAGPAARRPNIHLLWRETAPGEWRYVAVDDAGRSPWTP